MAYKGVIAGLRGVVGGLASVLMCQGHFKLACGVRGWFCFCYQVPFYGFILGGAHFGDDAGYPLLNVAGAAWWLWHKKWVRACTSGHAKSAGSVVCHPDRIDGDLELIMFSGFVTALSRIFTWFGRLNHATLFVFICRGVGVWHWADRPRHEAILAKSYISWILRANGIRVCFCHARAIPGAFCWISVN